MIISETPYRHVIQTEAKALMPVMRERYPNLTRFIAVDTDENKTLGEA